MSTSLCPLEGNGNDWDVIPCGKERLGRRTKWKGATGTSYLMERRDWDVVPHEKERLDVIIVGW